MSIVDLRAGQATAQLAGRLDAWAKRILEPYLSAHPQNTISSSKTIHDNVWGMIRLDPNELYILDSPLLQRLRYIRQLGVAHFLFPTTGYSRFEHTLGAVQKATELVTALRQNGGQVLAPQLNNDQYLSAVRTAALLHDVGHCPFSHVSEKFYQHSPDMKAAVAAFSDYYAADVSPSEVLTILTITSRKVRDLIHQGGGAYRDRLTGDGLIEFLCACVAGSTSRTAPDSYFAQIINGTIDCDKLDYLGRDSQMAGTPVMIDTTRLLSKLHVAQVAGAMRFEIAIAISGARALEELIASRVFLYDKLYFHQKVLAAEALLHRALEELEIAGIPVRDPAALIEFTDEQVLDLALSLYSSLKDEATAEQRQALSAAKEYLYRLKSRVLPNRIMAFAPRFRDPAPKAIALLYGGDTDKDEYRHQVKVTNYLELLEEDPQERKNLARTIQKYAAEFDVITSVYVAWPSAHRVTGKVAIHSIDADGALTAFDFLFSVDRWTEAYASNKVTGYVFADHFDPRIFLAAERAFADHSVEWNSRAWSLAKVRRNAVDEYRETLPPTLVRFRRAPTFLTDPDTTARILKVSNRLSPVLQGHGFPVEQVVRGWLWQFPDPDLQESALRIAEHLLVITPSIRQNTTKEYLTEILRNEETPGLWTLPLGTTSDRFQSGHILGYFYRDQDIELNKPVILPELTVEQVRLAKFIVLNDDWICSGTQITSLLYSWFGQAGKALSASDIDKPLDSELARALRECRLQFFFHAGLPAGLELLRAAIQDLSLDATAEVAIDAEASGYTLNESMFASHESFSRIRDFLGNVGREILKVQAVKNPGKWPREKVERFALGYGGAAALICSEYSVPTATLTAVWNHNFDARPLWLPLVPRDRRAMKQKLEPILISQEE